MDALWIVVPATALLSALLAAFLAVAFARAAVARTLAAKEAELERRLEEALQRAARDAGEAMEKRLRGVVADALHDFRAAGPAGFASSATRGAAATGAELLQEGLRLLMGGAPRPPGGSSP